MNTLNKEFYKTDVTLRITALWAFSEAFMGGVLHGLKIPFAGLALAFVASVCITLIALGNPKRGQIIKATLLVIAVKLMLSPHTPPMAYVAVLIQGAVGELLFLNRKAIKPAAFVLTLFSLLYSAFQHLLILTIVFGRGFWQALDIFLNKITVSFTSNAVQYSLYIVVFYLSCYLLAGIFGGILNVKIINNVQQKIKTDALLLAINDLPPHEPEIFQNAKKINKKRWASLVFGCFMLLILVLSYLPFYTSGLNKSQITILILRGITILLIWNYLINPLLKIQLQKWAKNFNKNNQNAVQNVLNLLPGIKMIIVQSWQQAKFQKKRVRFKTFINNTALLIVHHEA